MRRLWPAVVVFAALAALWAGGPPIYRTTWSVTDLPAATPAPARRPVDLSLTAAEFTVDATRSPPDDEASPPWRKTPTDPLPPPPDCALPEAGAGAAIAIVGVSSGRVLSPVALGDAGETTEVVDLIVESGGPPLYLVLSAETNMIWRIRGDTARVAHAVLLATPSVPAEPADRPWSRGNSARIAPTPPVIPRYAGVVGLAPHRVSTVSREDCFSVGRDPEGRQAARGAAVVARQFGRPPAVVAAISETSAIRIPSGRAAVKQYPPAPAPLWLSSDDSWPGGLADIRTEDVVAAVPTHRYTILPEQAGWDQLIESGAVREREDSIWLLRPIERFPPGLAWGPPIVLGALVPMPAGAPAYRCVRRQLLLFLPLSVKVRGDCR